MILKEYHLEAVCPTVPGIPSQYQIFKLNIKKYHNLHTFCIGSQCVTNVCTYVLGKKFKNFTNVIFTLIFNNIENLRKIIEVSILNPWYSQKVIKVHSSKEVKRKKKCVKGYTKNNKSKETWAYLLDLSFDNCFYFWF